GSAIAPSIMVAVEDGSNNVVTTDTSSVTIAIKSGTGDSGATLSGLKTVAAVKGVATFSLLSIDIAASGYKLTASDSALTAANSTTFTISATTAAQVAFSVEPANAVAGATLADIKVQVQDKYGNLCTTNSSSVAVALKTSPDSATLSGTKTATASGGVATFSGLSLTA